MYRHCIGNTCTGHALWTHRKCFEDPDCVSATLVLKSPTRLVLNLILLGGGGCIRNNTSVSRIKKTVVLQTWKKCDDKWGKLQALSNK